MDQEETWHGGTSGHIVLDGDPAPSPKGGTAAPNFRAFHCGQTAGWIKMTLGTQVGLGPACRPGHIVFNGDPASPTERGTATPHFSAHIYYGQRSPSSATSELLSVIDVASIAFSALTLLVSIRPQKNRLISCWRGYLSAARCKCI